MKTLAAPRSTPLDASVGPGSDQLRSGFGPRPPGSIIGIIVGGSRDRSGSGRSRRPSVVGPVPARGWSGINGSTVVVERFCRVVRRDVLIVGMSYAESVGRLGWVVEPRSAYECDAVHRNSTNVGIHNKPS
jgi:hypothetical protein